MDDVATLALAVQAQEWHALGGVDRRRERQARSYEQVSNKPS